MTKETEVRKGLKAEKVFHFSAEAESQGGLFHFLS